MNKLVFLIALAMMPLNIQADNQVLYSELDQAISMRSQYDKNKEERIEEKKASLAQESNNEKKLFLYETISQEYAVFKLDSALFYTNRGYQLAKGQNNQLYQNRFLMERALLLSMGGLYAEALEIMNTIDITTLDKDMKFRYYSNFYTLYLYKVAFCDDKYYKPIYQQKANEYLSLVLEILSPNDSLYYNYMGEKYINIEKNLKKSRHYYLLAIQKLHSTTREYAQSCFALANNYLESGDKEEYEKYLIRASIADIKNSTKETAALQALSLYLYQQGNKELKRAEKYINVSMDDATFYNNRLRILENSRVMPQIMRTYQEVVKERNKHLLYFGCFCCLLVISLLITTFYIYKQNGKLNKRKEELSQSNETLNKLNTRLVDINTKRESLASIYIDLCSKYIDKLIKYQTLVKRKIKANQASELLTMISSNQVSEKNAATFLVQFDKAFLDLYPSFVDEFNKLLCPEVRIRLKTPYTMCTELRTFALIRLGVKNTTDIARLLFLSNQTIYNCRSVVKNKAICKDSFEEDVMKIK